MWQILDNAESAKKIYSGFIILASILMCKLNCFGFERLTVLFYFGGCFSFKILLLNSNTIYLN